MGAVNTTYTFTATDTITSTKMNNIIDETVMTADAVLGGSGGSGGLDIASGKLSISANAINSSRLATNSVTTNAITDGNVTPAKLSTGRPSWTSTITGGVFGVQQSGIELGTGTASDFGCFVDFHSAATPTDFECRLVRDGGANGNFNVINTGTGAISISNTGAGAVTFSTSNTERMRITASGGVGIGTNSPQTRLQVAGGAVRIEGHAGEGGQLELLNAANNDIQAIFDVDPNDLTRLWTLPYEPLSLGTASGEKMRINPDGNVGIGTTNPSTKLQVNGTVTATEFAGPLTGNASSASTVSNSAITAAKLNGNQSGSAPIFGVRAWVNFNGIGTVGVNMTIRASGNVSSVNKLGTGRYRVTFATPMDDANYAAIVGGDANAQHKIPGVITQNASYVDIGYSQINTSTTREDPDWGSVVIIR